MNVSEPDRLLAFGVLAILVVLEFLNLIPMIVVSVPTVGVLVLYGYEQVKNGKIWSLLFAFLGSVCVVVLTIPTMSSVSSISLSNLGLIAFMIGTFALGVQYVLDSEEF